MAAVWQNRVYSTPIVEITRFSLTIVHHEMLNLVIALHAWVPYWQHTTVIFYSVNMAVLHVVETSRTEDPFLFLCLRNIWLLVATYDVSIEIKHIPGRKNKKVDVLSRLYSDQSLDQKVLRDLQENYICGPFRFNILTLTYICDCWRSPVHRTVGSECTQTYQGCL